MWRRACDTASKCIAEEKEYNKQRWDESHMESDFREGDQSSNSSSQRRTNSPPERMEVEDSPGPVKKIIKARKIRLNGKDQRQYLVRFKNQTADKDEWLAEDAIPYGILHLGGFVNL
ncbi:hypothetical protein O181_094436 [Austropuccinia psidii MF-1]|uniref:Chromo domain-containing protein n=1 Tax=Austropuccinia psidii MF-1 TaxID=1389203 RepID=A0A9Q3PCE2_9BASI|nr:hypothetical protein [Austropuccinia psidii MF-1]